MKMLPIKTLGLGILLVTLFQGHAMAYCSAPSGPEPPSSYSKPSKPTKPYCINEYDNTHTCDDWQIQSYKSEIDQYNYDVDEYIRKLKSYLSEVDSFSSEAVSYAKCEANSL